MQQVSGMQGSLDRAIEGRRKKILVYLHLLYLFLAEFGMKHTRLPFCEQMINVNHVFIIVLSTFIISLFLVESRLKHTCLPFCVRRI